MEAFYEERASKWRERELHVHITEMYSHMRKTELKEEELQQHERAIKKREEELGIHEKQLEKRKKKRVTSFHCTQ
jgi:hypothetical protein